MIWEMAGARGSPAQIPPEPGSFYTEGSQMRGKSILKTCILLFPFWQWWLKDFFKKIFSSRQFLIRMFNQSCSLTLTISHFEKKSVSGECLPQKRALPLRPILWRITSRVCRGGPRSRREQPNSIRDTFSHPHFTSGEQTHTTRAHRLSHFTLTSRTVTFLRMMGWPRGQWDGPSRLTMSVSLS